MFLDAKNATVPNPDLNPNPGIRKKFGSVDPNGRPRPDRIQSYLQLISNSIDMVKKDRDYIIALEKQMEEDGKTREKMDQRKRRLLEHRRVQDLLDKGVVKQGELMKQEVKDFKLLHEEFFENKIQMARCPSPSPVKNTPLFHKKKSIFLTSEYLSKVLSNNFKKVVMKKNNGEDLESALELDYPDPVLKQMSNATKVDELYLLAEKVVQRTEEGCKDIEMALNNF
ncbi:hypothetical protein HELRODRAFT_167552 [Helobdella robusta]|uniref:Uncharacterized protein n=1 Tax=Helobdella robusta TaxID=6412 RepID=T1EZH4_HELRO|nr:hypothetical protein HELRODRAFT_167552 [Helobdella robusta]ESO11033.1 hypothetical protein HELRODRAFT_167552 [Helobdella robusta]